MVATLEHRRAIASVLTSRGVALDALVDAGRYQSLDACDTLAMFMRGGHPDPEAFSAVVADRIGSASASGRPVHVFGEMVSLLWDDDNVAGALDLESLWNRVSGRKRFARLCAYEHASLQATGDLASTKGMCDRHCAVLQLAGPTPRDLLATGAERLFLAVPTAPHDVRVFVRGVLEGWGVRDRGGDAEMVASELATNAVRHARSPFVVSLARDTATIRIAVRDASFQRPEHIVRDDCECGGRGVRLVAALASEWGVVEEVDGKSVWADVAIV